MKATSSNHSQHARESIQVTWCFSGTSASGDILDLSFLANSRAESYFQEMHICTGQRNYTNAICDQNLELTSLRLQSASVLQLTWTLVVTFSSVENKIV